MAITLVHTQHEPEIRAAVERVKARFPQVQYINFNLGDNHYGDPCIFFRIVVSDDVSDIGDQLKLKRKITVALMNEARTYENGFGSYYDILNVGELAAHPLPGWSNERVAS